MAALVSGFVLAVDRPVVDVALKAAIVMAIMAVVCLGWLLLGAALTRCFREPRLNRIINVAFAVLLVV